MGTIVIMIGIQGSGKSEFYRQKFSENYEHISLDELNTRNKEQIAIDRCFSLGKSMVIDNTNPTKAERKKYIAQAKENKYKVIGYFMESKLQPCIERNNRREGKAKIPVKAIAATSNKLELPNYSEGFDELYFVSIYNNEFVIEEWRE